MQADFERVVAAQPAARRSPAANIAAMAIAAFALVAVATHMVSGSMGRRRETHTNVQFFCAGRAHGSVA